MGVYTGKFMTESRVSVKIADRPSEEQIDILIAAKKKFALRPMDVAHRAKMSPAITRRFLLKQQYCTLSEYRAMYFAMRDLILEKMGLTAEEFMARKKAREAQTLQQQRK